MMLLAPDVSGEHIGHNACCNLANKLFIFVLFIGYV
jgi:hypothetical protein